MMPSFGEALKEGRLTLAGIVENPGLDARLLLAAAAGKEMSALIASDRDPMPELEYRTFQHHLTRRREGEPVARILGEAEFYGLTLSLNRSTLIPRPETETLVDVVLSEVAGRTGPVSICDLGTGSGGIAIALLSKLPQATALAIDISGEALDAAAANARRHGVVARLVLMQADFMAEEITRPFDIVVSNPPYIRSDVIPGLAAEVKDHDPPLALDGGPDGLAAYRAILTRIDRMLVRDGLAALEIGFNQGGEVSALFSAAGLQSVAVHQDLQRNPRVVTGRRP